MRRLGAAVTPSRLDHLTFRGNLKQTRYGWLRLTPAYSVHAVAELLEQATRSEVVLDPFCGTGTTALVCAERGIACDTTDINPFLLWLTRAKTHAYRNDDVAAFRTAAQRVSEAIRTGPAEPVWTPSLHQIDKWWDGPTLGALGRARRELTPQANGSPAAVADLLKIAFCRTLIEGARVSFGHQSMSFQRQKAALLAPPATPVAATAERWDASVSLIAVAAESPIETEPRAIECDARQLTVALEPNSYSRVITSPPYPNRMSYIRELRPYMYWLGYLSTGREAGELDWRAIGGTWGCATSNVAKWLPPEQVEIPFPGFAAIVERIRDRSPVLSRYVHKYFYDMAQHCQELFSVVRPGGVIHYIVGNSKFYDVLLPVERIYESLFAAAGFIDIGCRPTRKRSSKKELFEFVVSARKPAGARHAYACQPRPGWLRTASVSSPRP